VRHCEIVAADNTSDRQDSTARVVLLSRSSFDAAALETSAIRNTNVHEIGIRAPLVSTTSKMFAAQAPILSFCSNR